MNIQLIYYFHCLCFHFKKLYKNLKIVHQRTSVDDDVGNENHNKHAMMYVQLILQRHCK